MDMSMLAAAHNIGDKREDELGKTTRELLQKKERLDKVKSKQEEDLKR